MTLNQSTTSSSWLAKALRSVGKGVTAVSLLAAAGALTAGCLDRPVTPATPQTTNVYLSKIQSTGVDKIDLLFMIDNSISMSDKQAILKLAVPVLVQRLITPTCVDANGNPVGGNQPVADDQGKCGAGAAPEFNPIKDIHIGIVTSSLGDHGSNDVCSDAQNAANGNTSAYNDAAELLPSVRPMNNPALYSWKNTGFLVWDPRPQGMVTDPHTPITMNETDKATFISNFANQVTAAGEHGCGYEAQLESWYRFLVDPEPVSSMTNDTMVAHRPTTFNQTVLQQRANFLRPDSLLAVVMLSDENDCSIIDEEGAQGWLVGYKGGVGLLNWHMPRASSACATNPNDKCCRLCSQPAAAGCPGADDTSCMLGNNLSLNEDSMNERCYNQRQRFGIDLLYPTGRYVEGLSKKFVTPRFGGDQVPNPIFSTNVPGATGRAPELVFLAGIVGIPWQDIASDADLAPNARSLTYLTAKEIQDKGRWDVILGNPFGNPPVPPTDPFMIEQIDPRTTGAADPAFPSATIQPPTGGATNTVNGHEQQALPTRDDLQFACIFKLTTPVTPAACGMNSDGCDCNSDEFDKHSPLCEGIVAPDAMGMGGGDGTQVSAKGYPGVRELQVLKDLQNQSIVASICPKNTAAMGDPASDAAFGYNPAVAAIVERLKEALTVKCLPRPLAPDTLGSANPNDPNFNPDNGKVPCAVVEVRPKATDGTCPACDPTTGRSDLTGERAKVVPAAREFLRNSGDCDGPAPQIKCADYCVCELDQLTGTDLTACQTGNNSPDLYGYCYVDPAAAQAAGADPAVIAGEQALTKTCPPTEQRILRFIPSGELPAKDGLAFIACIGANPNE